MSGKSEPVVTSSRITARNSKIVRRVRRPFCGFTLDRVRVLFFFNMLAVTDETDFVFFLSRLAMWQAARIVLGKFEVLMREECLSTDISLLMPYLDAGDAAAETSRYAKQESGR